MRGIIIATAFFASGCAAVFKGGHQDVAFEAVPVGADVRADGRFLGETPTHGEIDRSRPPNLVVSKPGYEPQHVSLTKKADTPWFFWDIATCAVPVMLCIPLLVDAISGAWYSYEDVYRVKLDPVQTPAPPRPAAYPAPALTVPEFEEKPKNYGPLPE